MDDQNCYTEKAEQCASPSRFPQTHLAIPEIGGKECEGIAHTGTSSSSTATTTSSIPDTPQAKRNKFTSILPPQLSSGIEDLRRHTSSLSRIHTQRSQHSLTVGGLGILRSKTSGSKPLPSKEDYVVEFDGEDDPLHAQNWPLQNKIFTAAMLGFTALTVSLASSIFSTATKSIQDKFHVGSVVAALGTSLYVLGFATGPILWAPYSELKGRRLPIVIASFGFSIFSIATATGKDVQTVLICRFFSGFFGACPLTCVAAIFSDMFNNRTRGMTMTVFGVMVFSGPFLAPSIGGFGVMSDLGWRWTQYLISFMGFAASTLNLLFLSETYPPVILVSKAEELRRRTKNWGIHAKQEEMGLQLRELVEKNFSRPLKMLVTERIVLLLSVYMAFIYGLMYLFLTAYPLVFQGVHGMNPGVGGLPYLSMVVGELLAGLLVLVRQPVYQKKLAANNNVPVPEWRLPEAIIGGVCLAGGMFWLGWTGYTADVHWIMPTLSGLLLGFGILSIFLQALNYLVDAYLVYAASAIAANTFLRSLFGAAFPLFARQMFEGMGIQWAATLLGCIAAAMAPVPVWFYLQGAKIRQKSAYAPTDRPAPAPSEA